MAHLYNGILLGNKKKLAIHPLKDMDESQINVAKAKDASLKRLYIYCIIPIIGLAVKEKTVVMIKTIWCLPRRNGRFECVKHGDFFRL